MLLFPLRNEIFMNIQYNVQCITFHIPQQNCVNIMDLNLVENEILKKLEHLNFKITGPPLCIPFIKY